MKESEIKKNYRYVSQGEFFITQDMQTTLVTTGMTECIALALIDNENSQNRLLAHLDGQILSSKQGAIDNISMLKKVFIEQTKAKEIKVHILGGQRKRHNYKILLPALEATDLKITRSLDINEFCDLYNQGLDRFKRINPMSANCTLICEASSVPNYISYRADYFSPPISEDNLASGGGLLDEDEREFYKKFEVANEDILSNNHDMAQKLRTSADKKWVNDFLENLSYSSKLG